MPKNKITAKEIRRRPEVVARILALSPDLIGYVIRRRYNPQMWVESKFAESVARALAAGDDL